MKVEVIKRVEDREYIVEIYNSKGIIYGHFTHIGESKKELFSSGKTPELDDNATKLIREEIRKFEIVGHEEYKKFIMR